MGQRSFDAFGLWTIAVPTHRYIGSVTNQKEEMCYPQGVPGVKVSLKKYVVAVP